jgi:glyoxylase-like metal-dependent hydrolase (beta-lactamase superfamily II)
MLPDFVEALGSGIYAIDTGFQRSQFDAAYLIVDDGHVAFVDTGTVHAVPRLLAALQSLGLSVQAVEWVIPTHVHLDHAGGVGALLQSLPKAKVLVHPRGARHLVDPRALYQGALAVYGQAEMDRSYGTLVPVPSARVVESADGMSIALGSRALELVHTPGHARHHHCIWDPVSCGWFTGDSFGLSYREFDHQGKAWAFPTTTPVQFEPDAMRSTFSRLLEKAPVCMYLTHYGKRTNPAQMRFELDSLLHEVEALGRSLRDHPSRHVALRQGLISIYCLSLAQHGCQLGTEQVAVLLEMDVELNAQGMACWLDREFPATGH